MSNAANLARKHHRQPGIDPRAEAAAPWPNELLTGSVTGSSSLLVERRPVSRRLVLRGIFIAPFVALVGPFGHGGYASAEGAPVMVSSPSRHAVMVIADAGIPEEAWHSQCEALAADGLLAQKLRLRMSTRGRENRSTAGLCNAAIRGLRNAGEVKTVTLLVWCQAGPLPPWLATTSADAVMLRLYGPAAPAAQKSFQRAIAQQHNGRARANRPAGDLPGFVRAEALIEPALFAFYCAANRLRQDSRLCEVTIERAFDPEPLGAADLPLIDGKLLGEEGI